MQGLLELDLQNIVLYSTLSGVNALEMIATIFLNLNSFFFAYFYRLLLSRQRDYVQNIGTALTDFVVIFQTF